MSRATNHFNNRQDNRQGVRPLTTMSRSGLNPQLYQSQQEMSRSRMLRGSHQSGHHKDREYFQEENIQLKLSINQLKEENQRLKMIKLQLERELFRFEKFIEEQSKLQYQNQNGEHVIVRSSQLERSGLVMKLKAKSKELVEKLAESTKQIEDLKRAYKTTRIQELEIELQNALDETIRLRQQLLNIQRIIDLQQPQQDGVSLEERYILQEKALKSLQTDNMDMHKALRELTQNNRSLKVRLDEVDKSLLNSNKEVQRLLLINSDQSKEIKQLTNKPIPLPKAEEQHFHQAAQLQYIQQMANQKQHFEELLSKKEEEIEELKEVIEEKDQRIADLLLQIPAPEVEPPEPEQTFTLEQEEEEPLPVVVIQPKPQSPKSVKRRLPRVRLFDVEHIGHMLRIMLYESQIPYEQIETYLEEFESNITIAELKPILSEAPFSINDKNNLMLLCRYLIEDNQEDFIIYDEERYNNHTVVKSILKKLIGKYELFSANEREAIHKELSKKLTMNMIETIQMIALKKKDGSEECDQGDFEAALKFHEVVLTSRQMEYLNLIIFKLSQNLNVIRYKELIAEFAPR